jgi:hypothetical protein
MSFFSDVSPSLSPFAACVETAFSVAGVHCATIPPVRFSTSSTPGLIVLKLPSVVFRFSNDAICHGFMSDESRASAPSSRWQFRFFVLGGVDFVLGRLLEWLPR